MSRALTRLSKLSWPDRALLVEAAFGLALGAALIALLPFRAIDSFAARPARAVLPRDPRHTIERVAWAVRACARRVPFRAKCFEQGLAAIWMLRRRGLSATLHYGAAQEGEALVAHVWVTAGKADVIGCENKARFTELARLGNRERLSANRSAG